MRGLLKHKLVVGGIALLVAAGAGGGAYAATQSSSNPREELLNDVAKRLNVSPAQLRSAIQGALLDRLDAAVKAGQLTQAQANRIKQRIQQGAFPFGAPGPSGGFWRHEQRMGPAGPAGPGGPRNGPLSTAATYLGLSDAKLLADVRGGKTLAQVAQAQGKSVAGLEQALVAASKSRLDRMVQAGWLTKAQEQQRLSRLGKLIDQLVEHGRVWAPSSGPAGDGPPGLQVPAPGPGPFGSPPPSI